MTRLRRNWRALPSWAVNLGGFGLLIALVLGVFAWQINTASGDLQRNALSRSRMVAAIIEESLSNAALARETIDSVLTALLLDKTRFVEYLNTIDPLLPEELAALARETGLLGITLVTASGSRAEGPADWLSGQDPCTLAPEQIHYLPDRHTGILVHFGTNAATRCIGIGIDAEGILRLRDKTALPVLLATLSGLPEMHYVRLEEQTRTATNPESVELTVQDGRITAEVRVTTAMGTLIVGLDAANHHNRQEQISRQFLLFSALLLFLAFFFSWLLYRYQQADIRQTRTFERLLAKEHEAAALGRATATIAHEVRNPLNAINMGLQRLTLESDEISEEQREILDAMVEAVHRADAIITELQRFTRQLRPSLRQVSLPRLLHNQLTLLHGQLARQGIRLTLEEKCAETLPGDPDLLAELLANLLANSLEAQPDGGFITIRLNREDDRITLAVTNGGCSLSPEEFRRLGEPYFTTKTRGTGLGLALCRKIAEAHDGDLRCLQDGYRQLTVLVTLPLVTRSSAMSEPETKDGAIESTEDRSP